MLVDRLLARPERAGRPPRKLALWARLVGGASWRRTVTLREPTADPARLRLALGPKLAELPAPVLKLRLEVVELAEEHGEQLELLRAEGEALQGRLQAGPAPGARRRSAQAGSRRWWRWHRGRAFRKHEHCSFPATTERLARVRRSSRRTPTAIPHRVNRQEVAIVREEWRIVDRWWTEEPVDRRYFDLVLETGENAVVYRDGESGTWFTQRA